MVTVRTLIIQFGSYTEPTPKDYEFLEKAITEDVFNVEGVSWVSVMKTAPLRKLSSNVDEPIKEAKP